MNQDTTETDLTNDCMAIGILLPHISVAGDDASERVCTAWEILRELKRLGWSCALGHFPGN